MTGDLQTTPLHALHLELGAKMVPFSGWHMPLQYGDGILAEHHAVRQGAGMFDVSHMGEVDFLGPQALQAVCVLVPGHVGGLEEGRALYTVTCKPDGGIVDDCIVYRLGAEHYRIVVNAANIAKDLAHFREHAAELCEIDDRSASIALIAVQGPHAVDRVATLARDETLHDVPSFGLRNAELAGARVTAARTGYTGEDGFELFVAAEDAPAVWRALLAAEVAPIGLGARDTLRLEARLSLYGQDIDETTNPYEAGLGWVVKLDRPDAPPCIGHDALTRIKAEGVSRRLVGFAVEGRGIVRPGAEVLGDDDAVVGTVTSGGPAPTVGGAIGLAYAPLAIAGGDAPLRLRQRGKVLTGRKVKGPFYKRPR